MPARGRGKRFDNPCPARPIGGGERPKSPDWRDRLLDIGHGGRSGSTGTATVFAVSPAAKVSVPEAAA